MKNWWILIVLIALLTGAFWLGFKAHARFRPCPEIKTDLSRVKNREGNIWLSFVSRKLTLFDFYFDRTKKQAGLMLLNIGIKNERKDNESVRYI